MYLIINSALSYIKTKGKKPPYLKNKARQEWTNRKKYLSNLWRRQESNFKNSRKTVSQDRFMSLITVGLLISIC